MDFLRTPDDRFANLPDYPFAPHYLTVGEQAGAPLRLHYVDEGPHKGPHEAPHKGLGEPAPVLLLHGEPSWSYLYRHMIPPIAQAGHRVLAPDLIGFGRSDKPTQRTDYTYQAHVDWISEWLTKLDLQGITLFCQDWGGLIGLRLVAQFPERFRRLVISNTGLPTGDAPLSPEFENWRTYSQEIKLFDAGQIIAMGTSTEPKPAERDAYNAPFPDERFLAGARQFPLLVPTTPDDPAAAPNRAAWEILRTLPHPVLTLFGADDDITAGLEKLVQTMMPGAQGQPHQVLQNAGHFIQEDAGPLLVQAILEFIATT